MVARTIRISGSRDPEGHQAVTQLLLTLIVGLAVLAFGLTALVHALRDTGGDSADGEFDLSSVLHLDSLEFDAPSLVFANKDYRELASEPLLRPIARQLRQDRKRIALEWLRGCQSDVMAMWRFRRFLTSRGAPSTTREELAQALRSLGLICFLAALRASVWVCGPYTFTRLAADVRAGGWELRRACTKALAKLPRADWQQIAAEWRASHIAR